MCSFQYVGSTSTPFRLRCNNYKACYHKFKSGSSVPQMDFFRYFAEEGHHGLLEDVRVKIIDRLAEKDRILESFWQHKLDILTPRGLIIKEVEIQFCHFFELFGWYSLFCF